MINAIHLYSWMGVYSIYFIFLPFQWNVFNTLHISLIRYIVYVICTHVCCRDLFYKVYFKDQLK